MNGCDRDRQPLGSGTQNYWKAWGEEKDKNCKIIKNKLLYVCVFGSFRLYERKKMQGGHMDCDCRKAHQEVSMELASSALIWQVLMAEAGINQQQCILTTVPQVPASPAGKWTMAIN